MPIYEYACQKCGHQFDVLQKVSDSALRKCPQCGALRLKKLVSAPQFRLKGTGWYETDFKQDKKKRLADGAEPAAPAAAAGSEAKPDKPDKADKADKADKPAQAAPVDKGKPAKQKAARPAAASD